MKRHPAQTSHKTQNASNILRIFNKTKGKLCYPRNSLSKTYTIVSARFTKQLINPEVEELTEGDEGPEVEWRRPRERRNRKERD